MSNLIQDLGYALRNLARNPVFAAVALLSLALGIGCNTAIFSLTDQILFRLLPVRHPEQLVVLSEPGPNNGRVESRYRDSVSLSYPMYLDIRDRNPMFSGVLARFPVSLSMTWQDHTERIEGELVSGNYFDVLGVSTAIGRPFNPDDDRRPGAHPVALLSNGYWVRRFAANPGVINQRISLNGHPMTIVGVTPASFRGVAVGESPDVFVPMMMKAQMTPGWGDLENRRSLWLNVIARLKPGVSVQQAEAAMNTFLRPIREMELQQMNSSSQRFRYHFLNKHMRLLDGAKGFSSLRDEFSTPLVVLMAMVGLVLLIACASIANLLMARSAARQREIAIRFALGAWRGRMIRQFLTESLLLSLGGGALSILVAAWTGSALLQFFQSNSGILSLNANPDLRVLGFTVALSLATGLIFGLAPALQGTRAGLANMLKEQSGSVSAGTGQVRFRKALVVSQIALSLLLLIGAGLFARSLVNLKQLSTGYRTDHLMTFSVDPALNGYAQPQIRAFYERIRENIAGLPGVQSVSMADIPVLSDSDASSNINVEGYREKEGEDMSPNRSEVGPDYFMTLGIPLLAGRDIVKADTGAARKVAVVNESMAHYFFGSNNPLGRHFGFGSGSGSKPDIEIVGVAKDGKYSRLREKAKRFVFVPYPQVKQIGRMTFYVRTSQEPLAISGALRREVQRLDSNVPVFDLKTMEDQIDELIVFDRLIALLSAFFGLLATLLAAIGLYGVMAYTVARRIREIGIRVALGADRARVIRLVIGEVAGLAGIGIAIAIPVSLALGRIVQSQLFGLTGNDPLVILMATMILTAIALLAGYIPALRATRVDPIVALRYE